MFLWAFALASCNTTRHLDDSKNERLLTSNSISLKADKGFRGKQELKYALSSQYKQQPNARLLYMFRWRLWWHYKYKDRDSKFARWINKKVAEPPAIYDDVLTQRTAKNFENYVRQRGYFDAKVTPQVAFSRHKAEVKYVIDVGQLYRIDSLEFVSRDSAVQHVLESTRGQSRLGSGKALNGQLFDAEKLRITDELKNRGYAFFIPNFVEFTGDSTGKKADVTVEVLLPADTMRHRTYRIGKVVVFSSLVPDYSSIRRDTTLEGIYFASADPEFLVKPQRLLNAISIRPDALYRQEEFDKTYRRLTALGIFRFISIKPVQDTLNPENLDVTISFAANKRFSVGWDADLNYSNAPSSIVSNQLLGVSLSTYFQNRNQFGGGEHSTANLGGNLQFDLLEASRRFNSVEIKAQYDLTLPRFADYFGMWRGLNRLGKHQPDDPRITFYERLRNDARARFSLSYNYLDLLDYYSYNLVHGSFGYDVQGGRTSGWSFDHIGVDILRPDTTRARWKDLAQNEFIRRSFGDQLFTGFLLRSFNYNYSGTSNRFGERWNFRLGTELSGAEALAAYSLWTAAFGKEDPWRIGNLEFSKFARLDLDVTYTRDFNRNLTGAVRIGTGAATPFGDTRNVPYVKQFFIGGPNSLRAWRIREIGAGSYFDAEKQPDRPPFYQTGDFRFEFNGELRFPLFWWFKGAVFLDGGNVWTLQADDDRPGSQLRWDSYRNFALGTGAGLRMDFSYFIFRLDLGVKLRRPYSLPENPGYWLWGRWKKMGVEPLNLNIAVGYPF